ncbi:MAG: nitrogenase component 1 [Bacillota bacterium]|nr:nitrogenase component 1 [Bacillota bacterium]
MSFDGNKILNRLTRLSEVKTMKQVQPMTYSLFPGYHCPLLGAMLTVKEIEDSVMLVIGPDECGLYTKMATSNGGMKPKGCEIFSVVLEQHDVTFGCQQKLDEAIEELMDEYTPKAVYLVTTCVVEVIGDDIESMAELYSDQYGIPFIVVHAENFKTDDHLPGIEHTLDVSLEIMEKQEPEDCVNVLGLRLGDFEKTEVYRILTGMGIKTHMNLPGKTTVELIRTAPKAKCNLVVHPVGLPLAKKMQKDFGVPYVIFERYSHPDRILRCYEDLFRTLGREMPQEPVEQHARMHQKIADAKPQLEGKSYISGNTALCNYELHSFLANVLGVKPQLLQISYLDEESRIFREELMQVCDPLVTRAANMTAMQYIYPVLKPDYVIGGGGPQVMRENAIAPVRMLQAYNTLGFDVCDMVVGAFLQAESDSRKMKSALKMKEAVR